MAFGEVSIDVDSRRVRAPNGASCLEPRTFDLLMTLAERPGLTASRDHLIETVWSVDEGSHLALNQAVADLRKALGDDALAPRFIETVPAIGYRWIYEATPGSTPPAPRWSLGPAWVAAGAALAIAVGGVATLGAYAWAQDDDPPPRVIAKR
ncbi:winged helix-turn-helix domain-containing protein [Caulobacter sp.]|uniref:winged helix-turn-helix domain-containing protein n=1 Tax=Caulobacter sp. TaxID=78 RepID=UPI001B18E3AA|nr:winged helix-turn-helix domain-containing protein [Caulobacter sp.]MBO9544297.1 winged helix-turn-helix transcriptional regulator [Caulobacter sp.]